MSGFPAALRSSESDDWPTPRWLVDQLSAEFGPFDLDPASTPENAKAPAYYTVDDDGLAQSWKGRVWLNPPYGRTIGAWLAKAAGEVDAGNAELVVALVPARVDARWWQAAAARASLVRFWPGRLRFGVDTPGYARRDVSELRNAPFPSAVLVFGSTGRRHGTRPARCAACKSTWWPARSDAKTCSPRCRKALSRSRITGRTRDTRRPP